MYNMRLTIYCFDWTQRLAFLFLFSSSFFFSLSSCSFKFSSYLFLLLLILLFFLAITTVIVIQTVLNSFKGRFVVYTIQVTFCYDMINICRQQVFSSHLKTYRGDKENWKLIAKRYRVFFINFLLIFMLILVLVCLNS